MATTKEPLEISERSFVPKRARDVERRVADLIVESLVDRGVEVVFGIPGGSIGPVYDALLDCKEIDVVTMRHEASAVFAASAYAQTSGELGVVLVTSGPGILNAMNGIGSARTDSLPILVIAGEASQEGFGRGAVQEGSAHGLNVVAMASHVTKWSFELPNSSAAPAMLERAIATAKSGRPGPVLMSAPLNTLSGRICAPSLSLSVESRFEIAPRQIHEACRALDGDGRKVILAGAGARSAAAELLTLAEQLQCPVMTTPKGKGIFPESHPLALGVFGMGGHPSTSTYLEDGIDVLLVVGSSLNEVATDGWSPLLQPRRTLIHIDVDGGAIGRVYPADIGIVAPARNVLTALQGGTRAAVSRAVAGISLCHDPDDLEILGGGLAAPRALRELQRCLPGDAIYTVDSGSNLFFALHYLRIDRPDAFVSFLGLGSMGSGLPAAIGTQLACPDRTVVSVLGDGGFSMVVGELSTAAALGLPIVVAVLNDQAYGMVEFGMRASYGRAPSFPMAPFDVEGVARSCGAHAVRVDRLDQLATALDGAVGGRRPIVLDIRIEAHVGMPTNKRFQQITRNVSAARN